MDIIARTWALLPDWAKLVFWLEIAAVSAYFLLTR